jgi:hypothetical protein
MDAYDEAASEEDFQMVCLLRKTMGVCAEAFQAHKGIASSRCPAVLLH